MINGIKSLKMGRKLRRNGSNVSILAEEYLIQWDAQNYDRMSGSGERASERHSSANIPHVGTHEEGGN